MANAFVPLLISIFSVSSAPITCVFISSAIFFEQFLWQMQSVAELSLQSDSADDFIIKLCWCQSLYSYKVFNSEGTYKLSWLQIQVKAKNEPLVPTINFSFIALHFSCQQCSLLHIAALRSSLLVADFVCSAPSGIWEYMYKNCGSPFRRCSRGRPDL